MTKSEDNLFCNGGRRRQRQRHRDSLPDSGTTTSRSQCRSPTKPLKTMTVCRRSLLAERYQRQAWGCCFAASRSRPFGTLERYGSSRPSWKSGRLKCCSCWSRVGRCWRTLRTKRIIRFFDFRFCHGTIWRTSSVDSREGENLQRFEQCLSFVFFCFLLFSFLLFCFLFFSWFTK